jgi:GT2 family glycosyltransferase
MTTPRVSVVVVSFESRDDVDACLRSLAAHGGDAIEAIVVDNASTDGTADRVAASHPAVTLIREPENRGFGAACNRGAAAARAPYVLFLNPDAEVTPGAIEALARVLDAEPDVAIVGPRTVNEDGTPQVSFGPALTPLAEWRQRRLVRGVKRRDPKALRRAEEQAATPSEPDWVSGSCLLVRRHVFAQLDGFDEGFFLYEEDVDLCVRARATGWRVRFEPAAVVRHRLGRSMEKLAPRARLEYHRSHLRYYRKHRGPVETNLLGTVLVYAELARWVAAVLTGDRAAREASAALIRVVQGELS